jgi:hypothetical protein
MSRRLLALTVAASALAVVVAGGPPSSADVDTTPPTLSLPSFAAFVVGSQISDTAFGDDRFEAYYPGTEMARRVSWKAEDASGICGYDVLAVLAGADPEPLLTNTMNTSYVGTATDYDDQVGGGSFKVLAWQVIAYDCAGNSTSLETELRPVVTQEDGWTYGYAGVSLTYHGSWDTSRCVCWSADRTSVTRKKGASVDISRTFAAGEPIALVMEKAPNRGKFRVYVDGDLRATVDTYSATKVHRAVVWTMRMPAGAHVVRIVDAGTHGRARIDLDAVITDNESL